MHLSDHQGDGVPLLPSATPSLDSALRMGSSITDAIDKRIMDNIQTANQEKSQYLANMSFLTHKIQSSGNTC